jgi:hypothetical protein
MTANIPLSALAVQLIPTGKLQALDTENTKGYAIPTFISL